MTARKPLEGVLIASDVDGTIVRQDTIFQFFERYGLGEEAERLNAIELSSDVSVLLDRLASKQPIPLRVFTGVAKRATFYPGADSFFRKMEALGAQVCLLSATYEPIAVSVARRLFLSNPVVRASRLRTGKDGVVGFGGPLMEGREKEDALSMVLEGAVPPFSKIIGLADSEGDRFFMDRIKRIGGLCLWVDQPDYSQIEKTVFDWLREGRGA